MKNVQQTVRQPLITEKSTILREKNGDLLFQGGPSMRTRSRSPRPIEKVFEKEKVKVGDGPHGSSAEASSSAWDGNSGQTPTLEEGLGSPGAGLR